MPLAGPPALTIDAVKGTDLAVNRHQVDTQGYSQPPAAYGTENYIIE